MTTKRKEKKIINIKPLSIEVLPSNLPVKVESQLPSLRNEQAVADHLIEQIPTAKPFCEWEGDLSYVHIGGNDGWMMEPLVDVHHLVPVTGKEILVTTWNAGYPITRVKVGHLVHNMPLPRKDLDKYLVRTVDMFTKTLPDIAMAVLSAPFMFMSDPILVIRLGRSHWVELFRWE